MCPSGAITSTEVSLLHSNGIKLLLIVNDWNLVDLSTYAQGTSAASQCLSADKKNVNGVTVPSGKASFLDIEDNNPDQNLFHGFADGFVGSGYQGGMYGGQD